MISALDGVGGQRHAPAAFTPGNEQVPILQESVWAAGPVWISAENLAPNGIRSPALPGRSESLYQLIYLDKLSECTRRVCFIKICRVTFKFFRADGQT